MIQVKVLKQNSAGVDFNSIGDLKCRCIEKLQSFAHKKLEELNILPSDTVRSLNFQYADVVRRKGISRIMTSIRGNILKKIPFLDGVGLIDISLDCINNYGSIYVPINIRSKTLEVSIDEAYGYCIKDRLIDNRMSDEPRRISQLIRLVEGYSGRIGVSIIANSIGTRKYPCSMTRYYRYINSIARGKGVPITLEAKYDNLQVSIVDKKIVVHYRTFLSVEVASTSLLGFYKLFTELPSLRKSIETLIKGAYLYDINCTA